MPPTQAASIRIVHPSEFDPGTAQTSGSERRAAIDHRHAIDTQLWGGTFLVEPGARTGIHHHGEQETIVYVLSWKVLPWSVGENAANFRPLPPRETSYTFPPGCLTRR